MTAVHALAMECDHSRSSHMHVVPFLEQMEALAEAAGSATRVCSADTSLSETATSPGRSAGTS